ncbi:hypothetical protein [Comamonas jiangduensis]|uniref:hypothetical protein n=1 Tax=Comamonas jiangduensis TaxID=1194168 RepID=UPI003BF830C4
MNHILPVVLVMTICVAALIGLAACQYAVQRPSKFENRGAVVDHSLGWSLAGAVIAGTAWALVALVQRFLLF